MTLKWVFVLLTERAFITWIEITPLHTGFLTDSSIMHLMHIIVSVMATRMVKQHVTYNIKYNSCHFGRYFLPNQFIGPLGNIPSCYNLVYWHCYTIWCNSLFGALALSLCLAWMKCSHQNHYHRDYSWILLKYSNQAWAVDVPKKCAQLMYHFLVC